MHCGATSAPFGDHILSRLGLSLLLVSLLTSVACADATTTAPGKGVRIVAAENFYGDIARQIGGDRVSVVSIMSDPRTDPHDYESSADDAKAVANAQIVIKNSLGYDGFVDKLMSASPRPNRVVVDVSKLTGHKEGDNPHIWYDPATMSKLAQKLATVLTELDPSGRDYFAGRLKTFDSSTEALNDRILALKTKYKGARVIATEPIFDYMAEALELEVVGKEGAFQRAIEEGNDPPAAAVAEFRQQLSSRSVKVLIYNSQAVTPSSSQMQDFAKQNNVPVVPVTETEPDGKTYQQWMLDQLDSLRRALGG